METPQVRPGKVQTAEAMPRVIAYFYNAAQGNAAIQLVTQLGVPVDRLGVTTPERIEGGQGMVLSIPCPDDAIKARVQQICRGQGAEVHYQHR
jgi:hypothetical protein